MLFDLPAIGRIEIRSCHRRREPPAERPRLYWTRMWTRTRTNWTRMTTTMTTRGSMSTRATSTYPDHLPYTENTAAVVVDLPALHHFPTPHLAPYRLDNRPTRTMMTTTSSTTTMVRSTGKRSDYHSHGYSSLSSAELFDDAHLWTFFITKFILTNPFFNKFYTQNYLPIVHLQYGETRVASQLFFLLLRRIWML